MSSLLLLGVGKDGSAGGAYTGPGNLGIGTASFFGGLRAYSAAYAAPGTNPAIDIVDGSGLNPATINILTNGFIDYTTLGTWITAHGTAHISKIYDQISTHHLVQATNANMPTITQNTIGSYPSITFSGASSQTVTATATTVLPYAWSVVAQRTSGTGAFAMTFAGAVHPVVGWNDTGFPFYQPGSASVANSSTVANGVWVAMVGGTNAGDTSSVFTVNATTNTAGALTSASASLIEAGDNGQSAFFTGYIQEMIVWPVFLDATSQPTLVSNQRTAWSF